MAVEKIINIKVIDGDLDKLDGKLKDVKKGFDGVEQKASTTNSKVGKSFDNVGRSADNLKGGVKGIASELDNVSKAAKAGGAAMKSALISTGVGALVVALGFVVANWSKIKEFVNGVNLSIEEQLDLLKDKQDIVKQEVANVDKQLKLLELQGLTNEELQKQKIQLLKQEQALNGESIKLLESQVERLKATQFELGLWDKIVTAVKTVALGAESGAATAGDIFRERQQAIDEFILKLEKAKGQAIDLDIALFKAQNPDAGKGGKRDKAKDINTKGVRGFAQEVGDTESEANQALIENANAVNEQIFENEQVLQAKYTEAARLWAERRKQIAFEEAEYKRDILFAEADILEQFGGLLQQLGEDNKALAVAGIIAENIAGIAKVIINTVSANAKAVAASPLTAGQPWVTLNTVAAGIGIASSVAATAKAISALGGGGSATGGSVPQGQQAAPSFNVVGTSGTNQIAQGLAQRNEQPIQAFVVGSNVTTQQSLDRNIVETATIG